MGRPPQFHARDTFDIALLRSSLAHPHHPPNNPTHPMPHLDTHRHRHSPPRAAMAASANPTPPPAQDHTIITFQQFTSCAQVSFWQELAKLKVDVLGLDQKPLSITGTYGIAAVAPSSSASAAAAALSRLTVGIESFSASSSTLHAPPSLDAPPQPPPQRSLAKECRVPGEVQVFNTDEAFRAFDKRAWLQGLGQQLWEEITATGETAAVLQHPGRLARFAILCFADIKRNVFTYWFAFPAVVSNPPFRHLRPPTPLAGTGNRPGALFSDAECLLLHDGLQAFRQRRLQETGDASCPPFFLIIRSLTTGHSAVGGEAPPPSPSTSPPWRPTTDWTRTNARPAPSFLGSWTLGSGP